MKSILLSVGVAILKGILWLLARMPRRCFYALADGVAFLLYRVARYRVRVVEDNLRRSFPEAHEKWLRKTMWDFYRHLADVGLEYSLVCYARWPTLSQRCHFENIEIFEQHYNNGQSIVVVAAHQGNWEYLITAARYMRHHYLCVYKSVQQAQLDNLLRHARARFGAEVIPMQSTFRTVIRYLSAGRPILLGLIADQTPAGGHHYWSTFMGQEARVFLGPEQIAERYNAAVYYCHVRQSKRGYYQVRFLPVEADPDQPHSLTERHLRLLEATIREQPAQWLWSHRRWKYQRDNIPESWQ